MTTLKKLCLFSAIIGLFLALCAGLGGCTDLQAKGPMSKYIDAETLNAQVRIASTQPDVAIADNALVFDTIYGHATVNWFAYAFGPKQVFCTAVIYVDLQKKAAQGDNFRRQAATQPAETASWKKVLELEKTWLENIKKERDGR
jgi:hypothetical protein